VLVSVEPLGARVEVRVEARVEADVDGDADADAVDVDVDVDVDVCNWLETGRVGCNGCVGVMSEGAGTEDNGELAGVGIAVGVFVGGVTGQVARFVLV
jgi:hypothetical protein